WDMSIIELATYIGWLVFPMALIGFWLLRRAEWMRLFALFFVFAIVLSMGPKLQWERRTVRILGHGFHLPMDLYQHVPILGMVGQSGRYMVIAYMAMGAGVAALIAHLRSHSGSVPRVVLPIGCLIAICLDFAYVPRTCALPV